MKRGEIIPQSTFKVMKHFIGLDYEKPKKGIYTAYRNRWNGGADPDIAFLLRHRYAESYAPNWYRLSVEGIRALETLLDIKIRFRDREDEPEGWREEA